jgi:uncharacterized protein
MDQKAPQSNADFLGQGWSFPPRFEVATHCLSITGGIDNINASIDMILNTPRGSRPLSPDFGSDLYRFIFRSADPSLREEIEQSVRTTLLANEPRIKVDQVNIQLTNDAASTVMVAVTYTVRSTNSRHNHVFPFSLLEGTNLQTKVG